MRTFNDAIKWVYTLIGSALSKFSTEADSQLLASSVYSSHFSDGNCDWNGI
jgi:hypothetical protein